MSTTPTTSANPPRTVPDYPDPPQEVKEYTRRTREYVMPFNYENVTVRRKVYRGTEFHGVEMNPINAIAGTPLESDHADSILIKETAPIVGVVVIGSACTAPGYVMIECEPLESFYRPDEMKSVMPVRFRIGNLWGTHMRADQWWCWGRSDALEGESNTADVSAGAGGREPYEPMPPEMLEQQKVWAPKGTVKGHYRENPLAGMSCPVFEVPASRSVRIMGGSELLGWSEDNYPSDNHYSFRVIRTTVMREA